MITFAWLAAMFDPSGGNVLETWAPIKLKDLKHIEDRRALLVARDKYAFVPSVPVDFVKGLRLRRLTVFRVPGYSEIPQKWAKLWADEKTNALPPKTMPSRL